MVTASGRCNWLFASLMVSLMFASAGCKTAGGWAAPWSGWGWSGASTPSDSSLSITKPSTRAPAAGNVAGPTAKAVASNQESTPSHVAAAGAVTPASGVSTKTGGVTAYPATAQANAYPSRPGAGSRAESADQVAPAGSYQVGPYGMQSQANAAATAAHAAPTPTQAEGVRTADVRGTRSPFPDSTASAAAVEPPAGDAGSSIYGEAGAATGTAAATATESNLYGPGNESSPAEGAGSESGGLYSATEGPSAPPTYGPPNTVAPTKPSTSPPLDAAGTTSSTAVTGSRPQLPASLSTSGGYRPGSTSGTFGARTADFEESQNAGAPQPGTSWR